MTSRGLCIAVLSTMGLAPPVAPISPAPQRPAAATPAPFVSNGCTGFREATFFTCCYAHDLAFWAGGSRKDRRLADRELRRCLIDVGGGSLYDQIVADVAFFLVRALIVPLAVVDRWVDDGWGRAWAGTPRRHYDPLTPAQKQAVADYRKRLCDGITLNNVTGRYQVNETQEIELPGVRLICGADFKTGTPPKGV